MRNKPTHTPPGRGRLHCTACIQRSLRLPVENGDALNQVPPIGSVPGPVPYQDLSFAHYGVPLCVQVEVMVMEARAIRGLCCVGGRACWLCAAFPFMVARLHLRKCAVLAFARFASSRARPSVRVVCACECLSVRVCARARAWVCVGVWGCVFVCVCVFLRMWVQ